MNDKPIIIPLPGGTARLKDVDDVTERQLRPIKTRILVLGPTRADKIFGATTDGKSVDQVVEGFQLTASEADLLFEINDLLVLAVLRDWTLPLPVPETLEDMLSLPSAIYEPLTARCAQHGAPLLRGDMPDSHTVRAFGDEASPTTGSAG